MSSQINRPQGYSINWSDTSQEQQGSDESLSEYGMLRKELLSRYPDNEPLKVYIQHFEELFIIEDRLNPERLNEALERLQNLEEICWALDIQRAENNAS